MNNNPKTPDPTMIDASRLARIAGVTDRRLRQLADESVLPRPVRNRYPLVATLHALLTYYREREENHVIQEEYPSFETCSKATGIPVEIFKRGKRLRCPALRGDRVRLGPFLAWYYADHEGSAASLAEAQLEQIQLQNAKLRHLLRMRKQEVMPTDYVRKLGGDLGRAIRKGVCRLHLLAPSLAGFPEATIEQRLKEAETEILDPLRDFPDRLAQWDRLAEGQLNREIGEWSVTPSQPQWPNSDRTRRSRTARDGRSESHWTPGGWTA